MSKKGRISNQPYVYENNLWYGACSFIPSGSNPGVTGSLMFVSASRQSTGAYYLQMRNGFTRLTPIVSVHQYDNTMPYNVYTSASIASSGTISLAFASGTTLVDAPLADGSVKVNVWVEAKDGKGF